MGIGNIIGNDDVVVVVLVVVLATSWMHSLVAVDHVGHVHVCAQGKIHSFVCK